MVKKKVDNRIRVLIENGVKLGHRTMFVVIGDKARDQVPILYDILARSSVKSRPTVLWCYKTKDEAISSHGKKRTKKIQAGKIDVNDSDLFDTFRISTTIHGRYYSETHTVLGKTYGVCVLQDFEALTPNLLARTIETVEGGGLIILLLKSITSLKQLYTMNMDVHKRYRTESHQTITCRFNERLILSLADCKRCLVVNDDLAILPLSSKTIEVKTVACVSQASENEELLNDLKSNLRDTQPIGSLISLCKTYDQAKAVVQFIEALSEKQLKPPICLTAARGRGKSAAMGLSVAAAVALGYVNIYISSPHPENLITLFEFILKGFDTLEYQEHIDYTIIRSTNPDYKKSIVRINITRNNRQTIQYISPNDAHFLNAADLLVIDEVAAIPLPLVKKMFGKYLIFMASTINGYEGTGRSLSLKLISQLQKENNAPPPIKLEESIRYRTGDDIESWLTSLLCLNATISPHIISGCPTPDVCELYYIDRDALFSYHTAAESFLQRIVSIYVASHYKNSPNDLQMMSDAPAHHLFCLLGPIIKKDLLPEVLVVLQVVLEGEISSKTVSDSIGRGKKASGDLIPWNISEQFNDKQFPKLAGLRIVRIATHPNYQRMGYGKRALSLLRDYYEAHFTNLNENIREDDNNEKGIEEIEEDQVGLLKEIITPRKNIPTLLKRLSERQPERIDYIGTSYGLTKELLKFWKSQKFVPVYLSQKANDLTGEHSCIMLTNLQNHTFQKITTDWLVLYFSDFRRRLIKLLGSSFRHFSTTLSLSLLDNKVVNVKEKELDESTINAYLISHDLQRLESYTRNQIDYRLILDLVTDLAKLYFYEKLPNVQIDSLQKGILLAMGLQGKTVENISTEFNMPSNQILARFHDAIKKITKNIIKTVENNVECKVGIDIDFNKDEQLNPVTKSFDDELNEDANKLSKLQKEKLKKLKEEHLKEFVIKGTDEDWTQALLKNKSNLISVKSGAKRIINDDVHTSKKKSKITKTKQKKFHQKNKSIT